MKPVLLAGLVLGVLCGCSDGDRPLQQPSGSGAGGAASSLSGLGGQGGDSCPAVVLLPDACQEIDCPSERHHCVAEGEVAECQCLPGFSGADCADVNECEADDQCGRGATCVNYPGGARCDCALGFVLEEGECTDLNECADAEFVCPGDGAVCGNLDGFGHLCGCPTGAAGDGFSCDFEDPCEGRCGAGECIASVDDVVCVCPTGTSGPDCTDELTCDLDAVLNDPSNPRIADPILRAAVEFSAGIEPGEALTVRHLRGAGRLYVPSPSGADSQAISSLAGLECWTNLEELRLPGHAVTSLEQLSSLTALRHVDLSCNRLENLEGAERLVLLESLQVDSRSPSQGASAGSCERAERISSLSGLYAAQRLETLAMQGHELEDLSLLGELPSLHTLDLSDNPLRGLTGLENARLVELRLHRTQLGSLAPLDGAAELRLLEATGNELSSIDAALPQVIRLDLADNQLRSIEGTQDMPALRELDVADNPELASHAPASVLASLTELDVSGTAIHEVRSLVDAGFGLSGGRLLMEGLQLSCPEAAELAESSLRHRGVQVLGR